MGLLATSSAELPAVPEIQRECLDLIWFIDWLIDLDFDSIWLIDWFDLIDWLIWFDLIWLDLICFDWLIDWLIDCLNPNGFWIALWWLELQKTIYDELINDESCDLTCTTPGTMSLGPSWCRMRTLKNILSWCYLLAVHFQTRVHMTYCKDMFKSLQNRNDKSNACSKENNS